MALPFEEVTCGGDNPTYCLPLLGPEGEPKRSVGGGGGREGVESRRNSGGVEGLEVEGSSSKLMTSPEGN